MHKEPSSDYGASFPDFPGCITAGTTVNDAVATAHEVLAFHIEGLIADGLPLPNPARTMTEVMADPDFADGVALVVMIIAASI